MSFAIVFVGGGAEFVSETTQDPLRVSRTYFKKRGKKRKERTCTYSADNYYILHLPLPVFKYHIFIFVVTNDPSRLPNLLLLPVDCSSRTFRRYTLCRTWSSKRTKIRGKRTKKEKERKKGYSTKWALCTFILFGSNLSTLFYRKFNFHFSVEEKERKSERKLEKHKGSTQSIKILSGNTVHSVQRFPTLSVRATLTFTLKNGMFGRTPGRRRIRNASCDSPILTLDNFIEFLL